MTGPLPASSNTSAVNSIEETYKTYFDTVYRISFSYLKNPADAEDVAADVFVKLMRKGVVFQNAEHEKAWLIRTTINACKDMLKHWWRGRADVDACPKAHSTAPFPVDETLQAIMELPPRYKDVLYLYYYEGYSTQEVAEILKKPHSTVRGHLQEARKCLKGVLQNEG